MPGPEIEIAQYYEARGHHVGSRPYVFKMAVWKLAPDQDVVDWLVQARKQGWQSLADPVLCAVFDVGMSPAMLFRIEWREDNEC